MELLRLADGALYWAKAHGRNRCVRYSPDVVEELSDAERAARLEHQQALSAVLALARAVDAKDPYTMLHSQRVAEMAARVALEMGWSADRVRLLHEAAVLHDVGKIAVPDLVLTKPGRLTEEEFALVREHPVRGAEIVAETPHARAGGVGARPPRALRRRRLPGRPRRPRHPRRRPDPGARRRLGRHDQRPPLPARRVRRPARSRSAARSAAPSSARTWSRRSPGCGTRAPWRTWRRRRRRPAGLAPSSSTAASAADAISRRRDRSPVSGSGLVYRGQTIREAPPRA